jgi:hypothetical protein
MLTERDGLARWQTRKQQKGALQGFIDDTPRTVPARMIEQARKTAAREVKIPYLVDYMPTLLTTRNCNIVCDNVTSQFYALFWGTTGFTVCNTPSVHQNDYLSALETIAFQLDRGWEYCYRNLDALAVAALETNKTTVVDPGSEYSWTHNGSAYQIPRADEDNLFLGMQSVLKYNNVNNYPVNDFHTLNAYETITRLGEFGVNNERNRAGEVSNSLWDFKGSKEIVNGVGVHQTHYFVAPGNLAHLTWVDPDARMNNKIHDGKYWSTMPDPIFNDTWGVYYNSDCVDASAQVAGLQRAKQEKWEISKDYSFLVAISDVNNVSPIFKAELLTV